MIIFYVISLPNSDKKNPEFYSLAVYAWKEYFKYQCIISKSKDVHMNEVSMYELYIFIDVI